MTNHALGNVIAIAALLLTGSVVSGCVQQRFEWGSYEPSLYAYYKDTGQRAQYKAALVKAISAGTKTNKVAPGLNAELGYLYMEDGNFAEARACFEREMQLFPESRLFLTNTIQRMAPASGGKGAAS